MIDCPNCGQELRPDSSNPQRMKCTNCDYTLDGAADYSANMGMSGFTYDPSALHSEASEASAAFEPSVQPQSAPAGESLQPAEMAAPEQTWQPSVASQQSKPEEDAYWGTQGTGPAAVQARQAEAEAAARLRAQQAEARYASTQGAPTATPNVSPAGFAANVPQGAPGQPAYAAPSAQPVMAVPAEPPVKPSSGFAIAALVLGILALLNCWIPFVGVVGLVLGVVGLVFGIVSLVRVGRNLASGKGMAIAGTICSSIAIVVALLMSIFSFVLLEAVVKDSNAYDEIRDLISQMDEEYEDSIGGSHDSRRESLEQPPASIESNDDAAWTSLKFKLDGKEYALMQTTLDDLAQQGGWAIDLAEAGYPNGYIVQSGEEIEDIPLEHEGIEDVTFSVTVYNPQKDQQDLGRCVLTAIWVRDFDAALDFMVDGEVGIGKKLDDASAAYGRPNSEYGSSTGTYRSITFNTSDYSKMLHLVAGDAGCIDEIGLSTFVD